MEDDVNGTTTCMKASSLHETNKSFKIECTDNSKFGTNFSGKSVYQLRYRVKYTDITTNPTPYYIYAPFTVTIKN